MRRRQWYERHPNRTAPHPMPLGPQLPEDLLATNSPDHALRRLRPLARRERRTARPPRVAVRARNPCLRARLRLLGWNVRFTKLLPRHLAASTQELREVHPGPSRSCLPSGEVSGEQRGEPPGDRPGFVEHRMAISSANSSNVRGYPDLGMTTTFSTAGVGEPIGGCYRQLPPG